jgi:hypothetical protein
VSGSAGLARVRARRRHHSPAATSPFPAGPLNLRNPDTAREALALGHNYIGTEHILLGLLDEEESLGGGTLAGLGITKERARDWLVPVLEQMAAKRRPATPD